MGHYDLFPCRLPPLVMTSKEKAIAAIMSLDDDASLEEVINRLRLMQKIELGIQQADAGDVLDQGRFFAQFGEGHGN